MNFSIVRQLSQVLKAVSPPDSYSADYEKMMNLNFQKEAVLNFFHSCYHNYNILEKKQSVFDSLVLRIINNHIPKTKKSHSYQSETDVKEIISEETNSFIAENIELKKEISSLQTDLEQVQKRRNAIIQELKSLEYKWREIPNKNDKKRFRLYSDLLFVVEDLQRSINKKTS